MKTTKTKTSGPGAYTACRNCPVRKLPTFRAFAEEELAFMEGFKAAEVRFSPGSTILLEGTHSAQLYTIFAGWAFRLKTLSDGRRQILNFVLPGDFIGLQGAVFDKMQHTVEALTDTVLCVFPREKVWSLFERHPSLGFDAAWLASREETMLDEHLLSVGQRRASERMSYLLLHLFVRAQQSGLVRDNKVDFPFTQQHLADALGFSIVHTNKTLARLRASGAFRWTGTLFELLDKEKMVEMAGHPTLPGGLRPLL